MGSIADRKEEFWLFDRMLKGLDTARILLLEGPSERGKSVLLTELALRAEETFGPGSCARADFKGGLILEDLFTTLNLDLGAEVLPIYNKFASTSVQVTVETDLSGARFKDANKVTVQPIIQAGASASVQTRGEAIMKDLRGCVKDVVLIIDTLEAAPEDSFRWIVHQFLPTVRQNPTLRIILGGQQVPNPRDFALTWGSHAVRRQLNPVTSVDDWHEFALTRHPAFPRHHIESICLGGLVDRPSIIQEFIDNIARQLPAVAEGT